MCWRRDITARSSAPILPVGNLCSQKQQEIARTVKEIVEGGRPEVSSQSMQGIYTVCCFPQTSKLMHRNRTVMFTCQTFEFS